MRLRIFLVALGASALLVAPALAADNPSPPSNGQGQTAGQTDKGRDSAKARAKLEQLKQKAMAARNQVLAQAKAGVERIRAEVKAACGSVRTDPKVGVSDPKGGGSNDPARAACLAALQKAKADLEALNQSTRAALRQIEAEFKAAMARLRTK